MSLRTKRAKLQATLLLPLETRKVSPWQHWILSPKLHHQSSAVHYSTDNRSDIRPKNSCKQEEQFSPPSLALSSLKSSCVPNLRMSLSSLLDITAALFDPRPGLTTRCVSIIFFLATYREINFNYDVFYNDLIFLGSQPSQSS